MSAAVGAGAAAGAAGAAVQAIKACGVLVRVDPEEFLRVAWRVKDPVVVCAAGWFLSPRFKYMTSYKGFAFYTTSADPLDLPKGSEVVQARSIYIPGG